MSLAEFQEAFTETLWQVELSTAEPFDVPHLPPSDLNIKRFTIYRRQMLRRLNRALQTVFPTVTQMLGTDAMRAASDAYFLAQPPTSVGQKAYSADFPVFLENWSLTEEKPYLPDVATLDLGCYRSRHAMDTEAIKTSIFTQLTPQQLAARRIKLHPACFWMASPFAICDIWRTQQPHHFAIPMMPNAIATAQEVVIIRPNIDVEVHRIDTGFVKALDALDEGQPIEQALLQGSLTDSSFNEVAALQFLIQNNLVASLY